MQAYSLFNSCIGILRGCARILVMVEKSKSVELAENCYKGRLILTGLEI